MIYLLAIIPLSYSDFFSDAAQTLSMYLPFAYSFTDLLTATCFLWNTIYIYNNNSHDSLNMQSVLSPFKVLYMYL